MSPTKPSGIPWLGEVPAHWEVKRLAHFGEFRKGRGIARADITDEGVPAILYGDLYTQYELKAETLVKRTTPEVAANAEEIRTGDLLLTGSGETKEDIGRCVVYLGKEKAYAGGDVIILRQNKADSLYLSYVLNSAPVVAQKTQMAKGEIVVHIYSSDLRDIVFPLPPLPEQRAIAAFLDERTARIDALVARKRRLVQLLKEKRQALITRAVTRGLDPKAKMKESGVPWLGEVPEGWSLPALNSRYEILLGKMLDEKRLTKTDLVPYLRNIDVQWDRVNTEDLHEMDIAPSEYERFTLKPGDLLVCEGGDIGRTATWRGEMDLCAYQKAVHRVRPRSVSEHPRYLYYTMVAAHGRGVFLAEGNPNTIPHLTGEKFRRYRFPQPPHQEQVAIADYLDRMTTRIDALVTKVEQAVERLQEYRTALISAAVTGKVRVG